MGPTNVRRCYIVPPEPNLVVGRLFSETRQPVGRRDGGARRGDGVSRSTQGAGCAVVPQTNRGRVAARHVNAIFGRRSGGVGPRKDAAFRRV